MSALTWGSWGEEWGLQERVSFNGVTKRITVNGGVTSIDIRADVYSAWVRWVAREANARFLQAMRVSGADPIPGGETGATFFTVNGWKFCYDPNVVAVSGVLYSEDYGTAFWSLDAASPIYPATVSSLVNSAVSYQNVVTGTALTPEQTAAAVWDAAARTLTQSIPTAAENATAVRSSLSDDINRLAEVWGRLGLDPTKPLVTGQSTITFGDIVMALAESNGVVTVTRA